MCILIYVLFRKAFIFYSYKNVQYGTEEIAIIQIKTL